MNFIKHLTVSPFPRLMVLSHLSFLFMILGVIYFLPLMISAPVFHIEQAKTVTSDLLNYNDVVVIINNENILYLDKKIVTLSELKELFAKNAIKGLYIKVDRRSSVGRVMDVWNLARVTGIQRVSLASDREE